MNSQTKNLARYLRDIEKYNFISESEEIELVKQFKKGDNKAFEKLIKVNFDFVISVAKKYVGRGLSLDDLISEGNFGLIKAVNRFDETRGFPFKHYAIWWVRQSILQALAENEWEVKLLLSRMGNINKVREILNDKN